MELCCHLYPFSKHIPICMYLPYMHYYMYIYQCNLFTNVEQLSSPPNYRGYFIFLSKCKLIFITCLLCNYLCFRVYHCGFIVGNVGNMSLRVFKCNACKVIYMLSLFQMFGTQLLYVYTFTVY